MPRSRTRSRKREDHQDQETIHDHDPAPSEEKPEEEAAPKRRRSKRTKVMSESGQTDAERRNIRVQQRALKSLIADSRSQLSEEIANVQLEKFAETRKTNNKIFEKVHYTREAVLDAENVELISARAARQVDKLIAVPTYDVNNFVAKLRKKCSSGDDGGFDWNVFGYEVGSCFNDQPTNVRFFNGPIDAEYVIKQRKKAERKPRENLDNVKEEEVGSVQQKKKSRDEDKLSAAEKQVKTIEKLLMKRSEEGKEERRMKYEEAIDKKREDWNDEDMEAYKKSNRYTADVDATQFLFNPKSFTQTVENIFSLSFLVKSGRAKVGVRKTDGEKKDGIRPGFYAKPMSTSKNSSVPSSKQAIISLSMADWRAMVEANHVTQSDVPHRGKSKYAKRGSPSK